MHVTMCCNLTSEEHTMLAHSTHRLTFFLEYNTKLWRSYVSKWGTTPIELTIYSSEDAEAVKLFLTSADNDNQSDQQTYQQKTQLRRRDAKERVANEEQSSLRTSVKNSQSSTELLRHSP